MSTFAFTMYEKAMAKHTAVLKRQEEVQRQIELAQESMVRDVESDKTVTYYRSEMRRHESKFEASLKAMEEKFEAAKKALELSYESEKRRLESCLENKIRVIENAEPDTPAYRKLKADKRKLEQEEEKARDEMLDASNKWQEAEEKKRKLYQEEATRKMREHEAQEARKVEIARQEYDARLERECQEAQKKLEESAKRVAGQRTVPTSTEPVDHVKQALDSLETALPQKKIRPTRKGRKLNIEELKKGQVYYIEDLETIDVSNLTEEQMELYDDLWTSACKLDGIVGCRKVDK
jgi:hypothetical protein